jgi:hypothetical protein
MAMAKSKKAKKRGKKSGKKAAKKAAKKMKKRMKKAAKKVARGKSKSKGRVAAKKKTRTTAEGMRRALKMKQAADKREQHEAANQNRPVQMPSSAEPDPIPHNLREQGDVANIIQNTSNRRTG